MEEQPKKPTAIEKSVRGIVRKMYRDKFLGKRKRVTFGRTRRIVGDIFKKRKVNDSIFFYIVYKYHKKYCNLYDQKLHRIRNSDKVKAFQAKYPRIDAVGLGFIATVDDRMTLSNEDISFFEDCIHIIRGEHLKEQTINEDELDEELYEIARTEMQNAEDELDEELIKISKSELKKSKKK